MPTIGNPHSGKEGERKVPQYRGGKTYFYHPPCLILSQPVRFLDRGNQENHCNHLYSLNRSCIIDSRQQVQQECIQGTMFPSHRMPMILSTILQTFNKRPCIQRPPNYI
ncbi:hypothetical protein V8G54_026804 [Vigna mungo]|uniref:Uncharacterized protein n=1 Tax=Vigna mungo TaxID=3915 RepID=A0AAQ3MZF4_VIGMU